MSDIHSKDPEIPYVKFETATRELICSLMERQDRMNEEIFLESTILRTELRILKRTCPVTGAGNDRGRPPNHALDEAKAIASSAESRLISGKRGDSFDLIIFEEFRTIFVKVKRSLTKFTWPLEVLHQYQREIAHVHRVPLTAVTAREFWVRHPNGTWQFFLIRHDSLIEVQADGTYPPGGNSRDHPGTRRKKSIPCGEPDFTSENTG